MAIIDVIADESVEEVFESPGELAEVLLVFLPDYANTRQLN